MRHPSRSNADAQSVARNETSSNTDTGADRKRRRFLFALGAGGASAVALGAASKSAVACEDPPPSSDTQAGYRETDHVRDYYRTAKI
jgi:hypothetical protein